MKKIFIVILILASAGIAYWLLSPFFIKTTANEPLDDILKGAKLEMLPELNKKADAETEVVTSNNRQTPPETKPTESTTSALRQIPVKSVSLPATKETPTTEAPAESAEPVAMLIGLGSFEGLAGHRGAGTAKLIKVGGRHHVRFEDNFSITNGPDLFVYFGRDGQYAAEARLGRLKGSQGGQNYEVPPEINVDNYNEVWVWCRAFNVPFSKAKIR